jgi:hypothetical protein
LKSTPSAKICHPKSTRKNYRLKKYPEQLKEAAKNLQGQVTDTSRFPKRRIEAWSNR